MADSENTPPGNVAGAATLRASFLLDARGGELFSLLLASVAAVAKVLGYRLCCQGLFYYDFAQIAAQNCDGCMHERVDMCMIVAGWMDRRWIGVYMSEHKHVQPNF